MSKDIMLTTIDNPFNPFTQFDSWYSFDTKKGYNSCAYLARIAKTSNEMSDFDYNLEVDTAIEWIVNNDPLRVYTIIYENGEKEPIKPIA